MENIEDKLIRKLEEHFTGDYSGHDLMHLIRVCNIAKHIQKIEGGDKEIIIYSSLLHDVHRLIQRKTGNYCDPKDSLVEVRSLLSEFNLPEIMVEKICHSIQCHEEYAFSKKGITVSDIETLILQDADNLDAMGAVGIGRAFAYGGVHNLPFWLAEVPIHPVDDYSDSVDDISNIHHFYNKLLKLKDHMNTATAKKMAVDRHKFMENYLEQFFDEWNGKK